MAKRTAPAAKPVTPQSAPPAKAGPAPMPPSVSEASTAPSSTPVRNSPIPKPAANTAAAKKDVSYDMIAKRAFEIHCSGYGGSQDDNWFRAERELRGES